MERPIPFTGPMVKAILDGKKTQTRRVVKSQPPAGWDRHCWYDAPIYGWTHQPEPAGEWHVVKCPYGLPACGDTAATRLWVRENHSYRSGSFETDTPGIWDIDIEYSDGSVEYREAEYTPTRLRQPGESWWRPPFHMHRWASRLTLEVCSVRVERVQDITLGDVVAEGWDRGPKEKEIWVPEAIHAAEQGFLWFTYLWDSINEKRGFGWTVNPWVWVIEFRRVD